MFRRYTGIRAWDDHSTTAHEAIGADGNSIIINNHFIWDACNECKSYSNMSWFKSHFKCLYHIGHNTKIRSDWNLTQNFKAKKYPTHTIFLFSYPKTVAMPTLALPCLNLRKSLVTNFCLYAVFHSIYLFYIQTNRLPLRCFIGN